MAEAEAEKAPTNVVKIVLLALAALGGMALVVALLVIVSLTMLGNNLEKKFGEIGSSVCAANPSDPSCR